MSFAPVRLLAIDTAAGACSTAVWVDDGIVAWRATNMSRGHAEALIPMVGDVMEEAALAFNDLDGVAVTVGPGSFTGLRVGLAAARAMALAARIPCIGVGTLEAVAAGATGRGGAMRPILVALDSKRVDVYAQLFDGGGRAVGPMMTERPDGLARRVDAPSVTLAGDVVEVVAPALMAAGLEVTVASGPGHPDARMVAGLAAARWCRGEPRGAQPTPLYLRPADAKPATAGGRRRP